MKTDFIAAVNQLSTEKGVSKDVVLDAIEAALASAYRRSAGPQAPQNVVVRLNRDTGDVRIYVAKTVVENADDPAAEIALGEARAIDPDAELGQVLEFEVPPPRDFGRIAAQTAKQVVLQRIREAERELVYEAFTDREGDVVTGVILRIEPKAAVLDLGKAEATLPVNEQVPTEHYRVGQRLKVYLVEVNRTPRGPQIVVSRTHRGLVRRLFELEVPEIYSGVVEMKSIAREPGSRAKVAVMARQEGVDPVGSCVGVRGVRIQNIVNELNGEKIDVVQWSPDPATFVENALSPASVISVRLNDAEKTATATVPERQLSLAIGREGQNARLAAKLTGWRIDIKSATLPGAAPSTAGTPQLSREETLARLTGGAEDRSE